MCATCWDQGNVSKSRRFHLRPSQHDSFPAGRDEISDDVCTCTLKNQGYLCIPCKNVQNTQAANENAKDCHGQGCKNPAGEESKRRRVCTWCDKPLPGHIGGRERREWNTKMVEAKRRAALSRQADLQEYNKQRLKQLRMSRRDLRGDDIVKDDLEADNPIYVRHLDTVNYRRFNDYLGGAAPSGNEVYQSKRGYWMYSRDFLLSFGERLSRRSYSALSREWKQVTDTGATTFARTTLERATERRYYGVFKGELEYRLQTKIRSSRVEEWHNMKAFILDQLITQQQTFTDVQMVLFAEYEFGADRDELDCVLKLWRTAWEKSIIPYGPKPDVEARKSIQESNDMLLALKLQEQSDRQYAEDLQYSAYHDSEEEEGEDASDLPPTQSQYPDTSIDQRGVPSSTNPRRRREGDNEDFRPLIESWFNTTPATADQSGSSMPPAQQLSPTAAPFTPGTSIGSSSLPPAKRTKLPRHQPREDPPPYAPWNIDPQPTIADNTDDDDNEYANLDTEAEPEADTDSRLHRLSDLGLEDANRNDDEEITNANEEDSKVKGKSGLSNAEPTANFDFDGSESDESLDDDENGNNDGGMRI